MENKVTGLAVGQVNHSPYAGKLIWIRTSPRKKKAPPGIPETLFAHHWGNWNQVEHSHNLNTLYFTQRITFPQRELIAQLTAIQF